MKKKTAILVGASLLLSSVLTACGSSGSSSSSNGGQSSSSSPAAGSASATNNSKSGGNIGPVTLHIVNGGGTSVEQMMKTFGNALQKKFPQVTFDIKPTTKELTLDKMIVAKEPIDIFIRSIGSFFTEVPQNGLQFDMTELAKKHNVDLSRIEPTLMDSMTSNTGGQLWGIPYTNTNLVLYYNKSLFDSFGVDYPKDGMTWEEVYQIAKKFNVAKDGVQYVGLALSGQHVIKLNNFGVSYVDPKTNQSTYDNEKWKSIFDVLYTPAQDPGYQSFMKLKGDKVADSQDFYDGKAAMLGTIQHHAGNPTFLNQSFNWDMAAFPTYKENPGVGSQAYPDYLAIPSFSEHKDEAMEVIKYLISDEFQMESSKAGVMTVLKNKDIQAAYGTNEYKGKNLQAAFANQFAPVMHKTKFDADVERAATQFVTPLAQGKTDINTALRQAKEQADKKIVEANAK